MFNYGDKNLLVLCRDRDSQESVIRFMSDLSRGNKFEPLALYVSCPDKLIGKVNKNLLFCIFAGTKIFRPPLNLFNASVSAVVDAISPPGAHVSFLCGANTSPHPVHKDDLYVVYIGDETSLQKFRKSITNTSLGSEIFTEGASVSSSSPVKYITKRSATITGEDLRMNASMEPNFESRYLYLNYAKPSINLIQRNKFFTKLVNGIFHKLSVFCHIFYALKGTMTEKTKF